MDFLAVSAALGAVAAIAVILRRRSKGRSCCGDGMEE
jgi:hypothetical protein